MSSAAENRDSGSRRYASRVTKASATFDEETTRSPTIVMRLLTLSPNANGLRGLRLCVCSSVHRRECPAGVFRPLSYSSATFDELRSGAQGILVFDLDIRFQASASHPWFVLGSYVRPRGRN